jgi:hypothetical protein
LLEIDCFPTTNQVSGHGFSRAEKDKKNWALAPVFPDHPITRDRPITRFLQTFLAAIREIFDESAYDRFLLRTNAARSIVSYRAFTRERDAALLKKPRCC